MPYDETFDERSFQGRPFDEEIEACRFVGCKLEEVDLADMLIIDSTFESCDLRMVKLANARLQRVRFVGCRLAGVSFATCSDFALDIEFEECDLSYASFTEMALSGASFRGSSLTGADFTGTDLSDSNLSGCDLSEANFQRTNLQKADLRGATNFDIDPDQNRVRGAHFDRMSLAGLLRKHGLKFA